MVCAHSFCRRDGHWGNRTKREFFSPVFAERIESGAHSEHDSDIDDERRLFYVALARAKRIATITYPRVSESGAPSLPTQFIEEISSDLKEEIAPGTIVLPLFTSHRTFGARIDRTQLRELFVHQGLSVTALNNYLECPWRYFYRNLLRIPEAPERELEYGTAIHEALRDFFENWRTGDDVGVDGLVSRFARALSKSSLSDAAFAEALMKGERALSSYYEQHQQEWSRRILNEYRVSALLPTDIDGLSHVRLRGDLDKITLGDNEVIVHDYKTGKRKTRGEGGRARDINNAATWGDYKRQLVFYKLLLDSQARPMVANAGRLEFVEPTDQGVCVVEEFLLTDTDTEALKNLIRKTSAEIWALGFVSRRCSDKECRYCTLREFLVPTLRSKKPVLKKK